jgi:hypothetical protein
VGVGGTTATGGGVAGTAGWSCPVEDGVSTGFLSAGVLCFRRSSVSQSDEFASVGAYLRL